MYIKLRGTSFLVSDSFFRSFVSFTLHLKSFTSLVKKEELMTVSADHDHSLRGAAAAVG